MFYNFVYNIMILIAIFYSFHSAPGGTLVQDGGKLCRTDTCLFGGPDTMEHVKGWEQVRIKRHFYSEIVMINQLFF